MVVAVVVTAVLGFLTSIVAPLASITGKLADAKVALAKASTDQEKIKAQERVDTLQARRDVLVSEGSFTRANAYMRFALAFGPMVYLNKIFLWDKVAKLGSTDPLDVNLWSVVIAVVSFYFLYDIAARLRR